MIWGRNQKGKLWKQTNKQTTIDKIMKTGSRDKGTQ